MTVTDIISRLQNPEPCHRPIPMWIWNGKLDIDMFLLQMDEMKRNGVEAFFIHPMPEEFRPNDFPDGLETEYLGEAYFEAVRQVVIHAAETDMKVWLYDEGGWPSGVNVGRVVAERPDLAGVMAHYNEAGQVEIRKRGYPVDLLNPETTQVFIRQVHEKYAEAVGEYFGTVIPGIFTDEPSFGGRVGGDEIPWTEKLPEIFKEKKGYELKLALPILFGLKAAQALPEAKRVQVICDFYHVITQLWRDSYFRPLQEWCHDHNLEFVGHLDADNELLGHMTHGGDFFKAMECIDWPGIDVIWRQITPEMDVNDFPKYASSVAHVRSKPRAISESFAVYGWDLTFGEMKWITDFQYLRGINALSPMAFYSDIRASRKIGGMSDQFCSNPLWRHYRDFADYVGRLSAACTAGKPATEVAVYYPIKSLWVGDIQTVSARFTELSRELLQDQIDHDYVDDDAICRAEISPDGTLDVGDCRYSVILFPAVDIVPIETLQVLHKFANAGGTVMFLYGEPHLTCKAATQDALEEVVHAMESFGLSDPGELEVPISTLPRTIRLAHKNTDIRALHRTAADADVFVVFNESTEQTHSIRVRLPVSGDVRSFDPETGECAIPSQSSGNIRLTLQPGQTVILLVGHDAPEAPEAAEERAPDRTQEAEGPFTLRVLEQWSWHEGELRIIDHGFESLCSQPVPPIWHELRRVATEKHDSVIVSGAFGLDNWSALFWSSLCGTVEYTFNMDIDTVPSRAVLDLGTAGVVAQMQVNGNAVGRKIWGPYRFDVTEHLTEGKNRICVMVTGTLHGLMNDTEVIDDLKNRGWYNSYARTVNDTRREPAPSGILGPLQLEMWT